MRSTAASVRRFVPFALAPLLAACATVAAPPAPVTVGIVAINDFHGNLEAPRQSAIVPDGQGGTVALPAGGAAWLASAIDSVRAKYPNHLTVAAGDLIGASPITSSIFLDEPAIGVMNRIGLDFNAVGNHEFDSGVPELLRKQQGGCAQHTPRAPCQVEQFAGAKFGYLAANTLRKDGSHARHISQEQLQPGHDAERACHVSNAMPLGHMRNLMRQDGRNHVGIVCPLE